MKLEKNKYNFEVFHWRNLPDSFLKIVLTPSLQIPDASTAENTF